jgi:hypothetical protein
MDRRINWCLQENYQFTRCIVLTISIYYMPKTGSCRAHGATSIASILVFFFLLYLIKTYQIICSASVNQICKPYVIFIPIIWLFCFFLFTV